MESKEVLVINPTPDADISAYRIVAQGAANASVKQASASSDVLLGVNGRLACDQSEGDVPDITVLGETTVEYGGTVTRGDLLTADSNGKAIAVSEANLLAAPIYTIGKALESGVASDKRKILIDRQLVDSTALSSDDSGTANTGTTAVEVVNGHIHRTTLTVSTTLPAIAGGANLAVGKLLYTLPAGVIRINSASMSLAITQADGNITADTPDGGIGTTIASGVVAVLGGTAAFENILTGQTFNDCDGTAEVKSVASDLIIESAGDKTVYFNVADGWAASGDAGAALTGTVVLEWTKLTTS
jgi:hypothetical protein